MTFNYNESKIERIEPIVYADKPKPAVMGYRSDDPIPSNNDTLIYWKNAFEDKVRENARLDSELNDAKWDIEFLTEALRQARENY